MAMTERKRDDDSELIERMEDAPSHGGRSGGNLQRDIATRAEEEEVSEGNEGITRVRASDKKKEANLPRFNPK
jgi:hypothetical protein